MRRIRISRLQHLVLDAGSGLYSLAGHNSDLLKARHIIASLLPGTYTLAGNNATLTRQTRLLNTISGTYSYVGSPATLTWATSPNITTAPVIIGIPTVGTPVSYTAGNVTGSPTPTRTQQWLLDGNTISGATASTYTPITSDAGHNLSVRQIETNTFGSANRTSAGIVISSVGPGLLGWSDNLFPITIPRTSFFDLAPHITGDVSQVVSITPNVTLPSGVAITNTPTWRVTATSGATLGNTGGMNFTIIPTAQAEWNALTVAPGTIWAQGFETNADVDNWRFTPNIGWEPSPSPGSTGSFIRRNPTNGILGKGCLELEQLSASPWNQGGYWTRCFDTSITHRVEGDGGISRAAGQPFYVSWWFKTNTAGAINGSTAGNGRKWFSVTRNNNSNVSQGQVVQDNDYGGYYQMYKEDGFVPYTSNVGASDLNRQPGSQFVDPLGGLGYCSYEAQFVTPPGHDTRGCFMQGTGWVRYCLFINPPASSGGNAHITVWGWKPGMTPGVWLRIIDMPTWQVNYEAGQPAGWNSVICWIYETGRISGPSGLFQWYDQIWLGTQMPPCPTVAA